VNTEFTYELLARYLDNACSKEEQVIVEDWAEQNPEEYGEYLMCWTMSEDFDYPIVRNDFSNVKDRIVTEVPVVTEEKVVPLFNFSRLMRVAAIFIGIAVIGIVAVSYFNNSSNQELLTYEAQKGEILKVELEDGTTVFLNADSKLTLAEGFSNENRALSLSGEAFFKVKRNESLPFVIDAGEVEVKVLGTSFLVENYSEEDEAVVSVKSGQVSVTGGEQSVNLIASESASFVKSNSLLVKSTDASSDEWAWMKGVLVFNKTPLSDVVIKLERHFNVSILYNEAYADIEFTGKFHSQSVQEVLKVIESSLGVDLQIKK
jgi:transmembrane sensor